MSRLRRIRITNPPPARSATLSYSRSALTTFSDGMRKLVIEDLTIKAAKKIF